MKMLNLCIRSHQFCGFPCTNHKLPTNHKHQKLPQAYLTKLHAASKLFEFQRFLRPLLMLARITNIFTCGV